MKQRKVIAILAMILVLVLSVGVLAACNDKPDPDGPKPTPDTPQDDNYYTDGTGWDDPKDYINYDYTSQMPGQWCTILSSDNVDNTMEGYFTSSFYEFNYEFDKDGNIVSGGYTVEYSAARKLVDVTAKYAGRYGLAADATKGQAFAMTLRTDLTWDDGTPIKAADFVYSMSQQLSPKYLFSTASNYYSGNYTIHNAENYVKQGQTLMRAATSTYSEWATAIAEMPDKLIFDLTNSYVGNFMTSKYADAVKKLGAAGTYAALTGASADDLKSLEGKTYAQIAADETLKATWTKVLATWQTEPNEELHFWAYKYTYPTMDFSEVGYFVGDNEYELVMVIDNTLNPLDENGNLTYEAGYYFSNWPLVKKALWEKCENRTKTPYTSSYCTSMGTSASWGPYKLTNYQTNKTYTISRNEKWFGYGRKQYVGQYQTDNIITNKIAEWDTAWLAFQNGELDGIGMDVKIAADYRTSKRAYFTPETYTFDLNLQSLANSRNEKRNNLLLNYDEFRKAISLSLDRDDYCAKNSPSSLAALGLLNNMYYYDVENGGVYRETTQAKEAILNAYGATKNEDGSWTVGKHTYDDIEDALDATTGFNLTLARQLVDQAVEKAIADGKYSNGEKVVLTFGIQEQTANTDRIKNWFQSAFDKMTEGTKLAGLVKIEYFIFSEKTWSEQFANGEYDLCFGAWGSAAFNPSYLLCETQISKDNRYAVNWDPTTVSVTVNATPDEKHADGVYTYNLEEWRLILQGKEGCPVNFKNFSMEDQLTALGAVETAILKAYYSIPVYSRYSASLMGYKVDYITYEYNTFMGYGGIRYMTYNYDEASWAAFVAENGGKLDYKK